jgi:hypothetical protein
MGYPAATGRGTSRTDATHARSRAPETLYRQLSLNTCGLGNVYLRLAAAAWETGRERGESPAQKYGALCADRLAEKRTARASGVYTGTVNPAPITRDLPLRQSVDQNTTVVGLSRPQILELKWEPPFSPARRKNDTSWLQRRLVTTAREKKVAGPRLRSIGSPALYRLRVKTPKADL